MPCCCRKQRDADGPSYPCVVFFFNRKMTISKNALKLSSKTLSSLTERSKCGGHFLERRNTFLPVLSQKLRVPEPEGQEHLTEVLALRDRCQPRSSGGASLTPGPSAPHRLKKSQEQTSESVSPPETTDEAETEAESETSNLNMCSSVCSSAGSS